MIKSNLNFCIKDIEFKYIDIYRDFILSVLSILSVNNFDLAVVICSNAYIQKLNSEFKGKCEPTDILSFNYLRFDANFVNSTGAIGCKIQGDLVISLEYLSFNAKVFAVEIYEELQRVTIHGILHLMGYVHETNDFQNEDMLILQEDVLKKTKRAFEC